MKLTPEELQRLAAKLGLELPEAMREAMARGDASISVRSIPLGGGHGPDSPCSTMMPADAEQLNGLLEGARAAPLAVGDVVRLRPWAHGRFKWPRADDRCIVTQVLPVPYRHGDNGTPQPASPSDIALAFVDGDGDILEFLHDRRMFEKVGSTDCNVEGVA